MNKIRQFWDWLDERPQTAEIIATIVVAILLIVIAFI